MSTRPQLTDSSPAPNRESDLLRQIERLKDDLADEKLKTQEARNQSSKALRAQARLRQRLDPLYQAIRAIMEDLPESTGADAETAEIPGNTALVSGVAYAAWKNQLPNSCGKIIDALLIQPLTQTQMATICKMNYYTARNAVIILRKNGLLEQEGGGMFRLKRL